MIQILDSSEERRLRGMGILYLMELHSQLSFDFLEYSVAFHDRGSRIFELFGQVLNGRLPLFGVCLYFSIISVPLLYKLPFKSHVLSLQSPQCVHVGLGLCGETFHFFL